MNKLKRLGISSKITAMALSVSMLAALPSCGPADQANFMQTGKVMVIGRADPQEVHFWADVKQGCEDAGSEMGYEVTFNSAQNNSDYDSQIGFIGEAIREEYDVIVIAPNSKTELNSELSRAAAAGIRIININTSCEPDDENPYHVECLIASSDGAAASICCEEVMDQIRDANGDQLNGVGKIGIVGNVSESADMRITTFKNKLGNAIMMDLQQSGRSISGEEGASGANGVVAVLPDGTELLRPEAAANKAAEAAQKAGAVGDEITAAANAAAADAVAKLKAAGYDPAGNLLSELGEDEEGGESDEKKGGGQQDGASQDKGEAPVDENGVADPAFGMPTPNEVANMAAEQAKSAGAPEAKIGEIAQKAAEEQAAKIAKVREEAGYIVPDEDSSSGGDQGGNNNAPSEQGSEGDGGDVDYFSKLKNEYFVEAERCKTSFDAHERAYQLLGYDSHGNQIEDTGVTVLYATDTLTTKGICSAVDELGLKESVIVAGYNADDEIVSYLNQGVLDATVVQNPYSMGYLGVIYAKKLIEGNTITQSINTGVTLVTQKNLMDDYTQAILYPGSDVELNVSDLVVDNNGDNAEASDDAEAAEQQDDKKQPDDKNQPEESSDESKGGKK